MFALNLREGLEARIEEFVAYVKEAHKTEPENNQIHTESEWMEEFQKWSDQKAIQRLTEDYLLDILSDGQ